MPKKNVGATGARIKEKREQAGMTQDELAERLGKKSGKRLISDWESDAVEPSLKIIRLIAEILNTTVAYLADGTPEDGSTPAGYRLVEEDRYVQMQEELIQYQRREIERQRA
jgi:transcriptional regulator with XRE-family HTH domain